MNRAYRLSLLLWCVGWHLEIGAAPAAPLDRPEPDRPNILFILSDDHTSQAWGCYGSRFAPAFQTPHIDRLAREGALLENCFVTNAICVPSRAAILTGQYSHINGVKTLADGLDSNTRHLAHHLKEAGYQTALVGKWHLKHEPSGFDHWDIIKGQGRYHEPVMFTMSMDKPEVVKGSYSTDLFTEKALKWMNQRDTGRPFALFLHFKATHEPWQFHPRHQHLFEGVSFAEPATLLGQTGPQGSRIPGWPLEILKERMVQSPRYGGEALKLQSDEPLEQRQQTYQKLVKDYLKCATAIDENIGRVLEYLDHHGLAKQTLVVYTSDQGYFLGEHNYFDKRFMLEESLRMPMVVRYPATIAGGTRVPQMLLNVDFAPTLLDYAGVPVPEVMHGESFRKYLENPSSGTGRESIYYRYWENSRQRPAHYGVRTRSAKLIYYDGLRAFEQSPGWEFYDLAHDPQETINRSEASEHQSQIIKMKQMMESWRQRLGDIQ